MRMVQLSLKNGRIGPMTKLGEFSVMFISQFVSPYQNQAAIHPVFEVDGTTGNNLLLLSGFDIQDM